MDNVGFHDAFKLYGRPEKYIWDIKDPKSLFFAYPQGQDRLVCFFEKNELITCSIMLIKKKTEFILGYRGSPPCRFPRDHTRWRSVQVCFSRSSKPALEPKTAQR